MGKRCEGQGARSAKKGRTGLGGVWCPQDSLRTGWACKELEGPYERGGGEERGGGGRGRDGKQTRKAREDEHAEKDLEGGGERFAKGVDVGGAADRLRCRLIRRSFAEVLSLDLCGERGDARGEVYVLVDLQNHVLLPGPLRIRLETVQS